MGYQGSDYVPSDTTPTAVEVVDIGTGAVAADEAACATECDAAPGCNAASYYGMMPEAEWPGKKNCWLKNIAAACKLPADAATDNPLAMLLMKVTEEECTFLANLRPFALHLGMNVNCDFA
jgi:hypothetical protein